MEGLTRKKLIRDLNRYKYFYLMLAPVIVWYVIFCYAPMYGGVTAFQDYVMHKGISGSAWVGLKHFRALQKDIFFWRAFRNSVIIALMRMARAHAFVSGRDFVIPEDIHDVFFAVASHRVRMNARAKAEGATLNNLLSMVLRQVPVPKVNP